MAAAREGDRRPPPAAIALRSDGTSTHGRDLIRSACQAAERDIPIYTVALGTDEDTIQVGGRTGAARRACASDRDTLWELVRLSGGHESPGLGRVGARRRVRALGSQVSMRPERREIMAAFAAGAALLTLSGGGASWRWFGRLP